MTEMTHKATQAHNLHLNLPKDIFALLTNRLLFRLGFGLIGVFLPIFFYQLFNSSIYAVIFIYILIYIIGVLSTPVSSKLLNVIGIKHLMRLAVLPASIAIAALYFAGDYKVLSVSVFIIAIAMYRAAYWVPYQTDLGHFLGHKKVSIHLAIYRNALQIMNAITPLVGGLLIAAFEFKSVFVFSALALFATLVPIHFIKQVYERYSWGYRETFMHLFAHKNRALVYAYAADGAQGVVTAIIWPVFIFELLNGNYASVGFITSLTTIAILLINVVVGKIIERVGRTKVLKYSTLISATGWVIKVFVDSAFQIFITDTYHRLGRAANRMSFDSSTYEQAADNGHYIDEFTTLKNMAIDIGRVVMLILVALLVYFVGNIRIVFIIAALATLMMSFLNKRISVR